MLTSLPTPPPPSPLQLYGVIRVIVDTAQADKTKNAVVFKVHFITIIMQVALVVKHRCNLFCSIEFAFGGPVSSMHRIWAVCF